MTRLASFIARLTFPIQALVVARLTQTCFDQASSLCCVAILTFQNLVKSNSKTTYSQLVVLTGKC